MLVDPGGRVKALSGAFTAVADDVGTIEKNPAGTASLKNTEFFVSHNKLMGDVNYNALLYSMRFNDLAFGVSARLLYMPFTHFNEWGDNAGSSVITNSVITFNAAYNLIRSYDFFGLSIGGNVKLYILGVPEEIAKDQTKINVAFDLGFLTRFNFLKAYNTNEKNFSIGLAVKNLAPFVDDEPPPTMATLGVAYKPIEILMFSFDFNYLINYTQETYKNWSFSVGIEWKFTKFSSLLAGFTAKSSPSFSLGIALNFDNFSITAVYTPDLVDVSKFSISGSLKLGDMGRKKKEEQIKKDYALAIKVMAEGNYKEASTILKEIIKRDKTFTPAKKLLKQIEKQLESENTINSAINEKRLE